MNYNQLLVTFALIHSTGLRTLVVGSRILTEKEYETFAAALRHAKSTLHDRQANVQVASPHYFLFFSNNLAVPCKPMTANS
jgi:hypothetical protein